MVQRKEYKQIGKIKLLMETEFMSGSVSRARLINRKIILPENGQTVEVPLVLEDKRFLSSVHNIDIELVDYMDLKRMLKYIRFRHLHQE